VFIPENRKEEIAMSPSSSAYEFLKKEFCEAFATVFEQTAGEPYLLKSSEPTAPAEQDDDLSYVLEFKGSIIGTMVVHVDSRSAAVLAARLIGGPVEDDSTSLPEHEDAVSEIVGQTAGVVANSIRTRFGAAEIQVARRSAAADASPFAITLQPAVGTDPVSIRLLPDQHLLDSILRELSSSSASSTSAQLSSSPETAASSEQQNLRLVMDVELDLTLRFGQRILPLSEVADLTTGSVIELDRIVDEPVELLLGDRVIARGDVVIVDGNYGLRITELASIDQSALLSA
jgi:flagellar motor switch protein FliN/FliY